MTDSTFNYARLIKLGSILGLLALINLAVFGGLFSSRTLNLHWRVLATASDDAGPYLLVQFAMSDERAVKSIEVQRLSADGEAVETVWQINGKSDPLNTFSFGSTIKGMDRTDDQAGRPRLRPGQTYRIQVRASGFHKGELDFET